MTLIATTAKYWPARGEYRIASLIYQQYRILGAFTLTYHYLGVAQTEGDATVTHFIRFNPYRQVIERVQDDIHPFEHQQTASEMAKEQWARGRFARKAGIFLPTEEDYAILHDELERGAAFRAFDVDNEIN